MRPYLKEEDGEEERREKRMKGGIYGEGVKERNSCTEGLIFLGSDERTVQLTENRLTV